MRLYHQLVLFMLAATVLPLAVVGFWLLRQSELELSRRIGMEQRALATAAAGSAAAELMGAVSALQRTVAPFDPERISVEEKKGLLGLLYAQSPLVSAVAWADPGTGSTSPPQFLVDPQGGHPGFDEATGAERLVAAISAPEMRRLDKGHVALSPAYRHSLGRMAALTVAIKLGDGPDDPCVLVELGLGALEASLAERAQGSGRIDLVDGAGLVLASSEPSLRLAPLEPEVWAEVTRRLEGAGELTFTARAADPRRMSIARVPKLGLFAIASIEEAAALAPVRSLRRTVLAGVGGALALLLAVGFAFTRSLQRRLGAVSSGADAYAQGDLSRRLPVEGADELAELAETFNRMGSELEAARSRLTRWNDELKQRVEEATADLKAAQAQLVEAQKMAAIGQLGAGVAHEINNPLCGILGNAQLMMLDREESDPDFDALRKIEQSAKRCKEITQNLLRFSQLQGRAELRPIDLNAVVRDAVAASGRQSGGDGVTVSVKLQPGALTVHGDPGQLAQVVGALLSNARTAMAKAEEKTLTIGSREAGAEILLEVGDTGKGIRPEHLTRIFDPFFTTKDVWSNVGLGLSVAYRVITEHGGRIEVESEVGKGSTFTVRLPKLSPERLSSTAPTRSTPGAVGGQGVGITG